MRILMRCLAYSIEGSMATMIVDLTASFRYEGKPNLIPAGSWAPCDLRTCRLSFLTSDLGLEMRRQSASTGSIPVSLTVAPVSPATTTGPLRTVRWCMSASGTPRSTSARWGGLRRWSSTPAVTQRRRGVSFIPIVNYPVDWVWVSRRSVITSP